MDIRIDSARLEHSMQTLDAFHEAGTLYTRRSFTDVYKRSRDWLFGQMQQSGLSVRIDAVGNIVGTKEGRDQSLGAIAVGSHTDTVANGGRYDGIIGVLGALEIVRAFDDAGIQLNHDLQVIDFLAEEPSCFGISTVGSRGLVGELTEEMLLQQDDDGRTLREGIAMMGGNPESLQPQRRLPGSIEVFLEMHIEQGPILEEEHIDIGVVTGIVGIQRFRVKVHGQGGHAGTVPMDTRRDALVAASKVVQAVHRYASEANLQDGPCVGTVGELYVVPNHANVIPDTVSLIFELRSLSNEKTTLLADRILNEIRSIEEATGCTTSVEKLSVSKPVLCDGNLMLRIEQAASTLGLSGRRMPSGAGHDASKMAAIAPVGMIFVPSQRGVSHTPEEFTPMSQVVNGIRVLAETIYRYD